MSSQPSPQTLDLCSQTDAWLIADCLRQAGGVSGNGVVAQESSRAFRELVNRYVGLVFNLVYRMVQDHGLAEEITQDVFVKAYQNLTKFDTARPFKPWLLRIASNTAISAIRKKNRPGTEALSLNALEEQGVQISEDQIRPVDGASNYGESPHSCMERQFNHSEVVTQLAQLDEKYRQVLILRYLKELSYEEIAESLDIPLNTVRTWIKRGLEHLRRQMTASEDNQAGT